MADATLQVAQRFPVGTSVGAYARTITGDNPTGAPRGTASATASVSSAGTLSYTGLVAGKEYFAYALVSGEHRYVAFSADVASQTYDERLALAEAHVADTALDGGPHGLPSLAADGVAIGRSGGALTALDVATQAELDVEKARLAVVREAPINVRYPEYGAVGDATANDTAALQAALTAAGVAAASTRRAADVFIPPGDYKYSTVLSVPAGVNVKGSGGATRLWPQGVDGFTFPVATMFTPQVLEGFWLENWNNTNTATAFKVPGTATLTDRRYGVRVRDVHVGYFNVGFDLRSAWEWTLDGVVGYSVGHAVRVRGQCARIRLVNNCSFNPIGFTPTGSPKVGLLVTPVTDYTGGASTRPEDVQDHGSTFLGYDVCVKLDDFLVCELHGTILDFATWYGVQFRESQGLLIDGCYLATTDGAYGAAIDLSAGILSDAPAGAGVGQATIRANRIWAGTATANARGIVLAANQDGHIVEGNFLSGFNGANGRDIYALSNRGLSIRRNRCRSTGSHSILVETPTGDHDVGPNETARAVSVPGASVASAAAVTLPAYTDVVQVTGTTGITSIAASRPGRRVTLIFADALTVTDGGNLRLAGNFVTTVDDTLTLACDGTNWHEVGRSVN